MGTALVAQTSGPLPLPLDLEPRDVAPGHGEQPFDDVPEWSLRVFFIGPSHRIVLQTRWVRRNFLVTLETIDVSESGFRTNAAGCQFFTTSPVLFRVNR